MSRTRIRAAMLAGSRGREQQEDEGGRDRDFDDDVRGDRDEGCGNGGLDPSEQAAHGHLRSVAGSGARGGMRLAARSFTWRREYRRILKGS